jgi:hypothetical protein
MERNAIDRRTPLQFVLAGFAVHSLRITR